jgi:hypothetical protein
MLNLAHNQWASRPASARFWNLGHLAESLRNMSPAAERTYSLAALKCQATEQGDIRLVSPRGSSAFSHWSFRQFCTLAGCPADFLTGTLGNYPGLAVDCLNTGLQVKSKKRLEDERSGDVKLLAQADNGDVKLLAAYSDKYARVADLEVVEALLKYAPDWKTPPARPNDEETAKFARPATKDDLGGFTFVGEGEMIAPAGVYRDDRSMFCFLVNPTQVIDNGPNGGGLYQGLIGMNSEVGFKKLKFMSFLFGGACGNHYIHNASQINEVEFVHKGRADGTSVIANWRAVMIDAVTRYSHEGMAAAARMVEAAKGYTLGHDKATTLDRLADMKSLALARVHLEQAWNRAEQYGHIDAAGLPPTTVWGFVGGLTRYSQEEVHANKRHDLDAAGAKLLAMAS